MHRYYHLFNTETKTGSWCDAFVVRARVYLHTAKGSPGSSPAEGSAGLPKAEGLSQVDQMLLEREAFKLLYMTPALLQSTDGRLPRQHRYELFAAGEIERMLEGLLSFAKQGLTHTGRPDTAYIRARAD